MSYKRIYWSKPAVPQYIGRNLLCPDLMRTRLPLRLTKVIVNVENNQVDIQDKVNHKYRGQVN